MLIPADIPYPTLFRELLAWICLFELDLLKFLPLSCAFDWNFYYTLVTRTSVPIVVIAVLALCVVRVCGSVRLGGRRLGVGKWGN